MLFLFIGSTYSSFSQNTNQHLQLGEAFDDAYNKRESFDHKFLGHSGDDLYYSNWHSDYARMVSIYKFDKNLKLTKEIPTKFKLDKKHIFFTRILNLKNRDLLVGLSHNQRKKRSTLVSIDLSNGIEEHNIQQFHQFPYDQNNWFIGGKTRVIDAKGFKVSDNKEFFVFASPQNGRKKNSTKYSISVFDQELNLLHEKELTFEHKGNQLVILNFDINNQGEVFFTTKESKKNDFFDLAIFKSGKKNIFNKIKSTVSVYKLDQQGNLEKLESPSNSKYIFDLEFYLNPADELIMTGYCLKNERGTIFLSKYKNSGELAFQEHHPIDLEPPFKEKLRNPLSFEILPSLLNIDNILIDPTEKTITVLSEFFYTKTKKHANGKSINIHSDDFFIASFSFDGELLWKKQISKKFSTSEGGRYYQNQLSYAFGFNSVGKIALIFYDYNFEKASKLGKFFKDYHEKMRIEKIIIDQDGEILSRAPIASKEKLDGFELTVNLSQSTEIHPEQLILFFTRGRLFKSAKAKIGVFNILE